jgi:ketosteroid isomerase-like protein
VGSPPPHSEFVYTSCPTSSLWSFKVTLNVLQTNAAPFLVPSPTRRFPSAPGSPNGSGIYADGDTVVVLWDGESTRGDGKPYENAYAWFMRFREGLVVEATAFYDSIAFNEL